MENKMKKEFATKVSSVITEMTGWKCEIREIVKNNDLKRVGIIIHKDNSNIAPTVYINENLSEEAFNDIYIREAAEQFIEIVDKSNAPSSVADLQKVFSDKTEILNRVFYTLVSRKWNTDSDIVSRPVNGDLQYVYRIAFYPPLEKKLALFC